MSHCTLPVPTRPSFPHLIDLLLTSEIRRVNDVLGLCCWEEPESVRGACNGGFPCQETATVSDLRDEQVYCLSHFREVIG